MNPRKKGTFKFSPPENPYDNRTLEGGKAPPRSSPEGRDSLPANLLSGDKSKGSKKLTANLNIKRAESAADNHAAKYRDYDKFNSEAAIPEKTSPDGSFVPNQPKVYRPSKDEVKHKLEATGSKKRLHEKNISLKSGETLTPNPRMTDTLAPFPAPRSRSSSPTPAARKDPQHPPKMGPARPKELKISPFPEEGYSPFDRLPSKPLHKRPPQGGDRAEQPQGKEKGKMESPLQSPEEKKLSEVTGGHKVNNSLKVQQGMYQAKLGEVPPLPERKNFPGQLKPPLVDSDDEASSEPSDSPPAIPKNKISYVHIDPRKVYTPAEEPEEGPYLQPNVTQQNDGRTSAPAQQPMLTLTDFDRLNKREIAPWNYDDSSSCRTSDSSDSEDVKQKPLLTEQPLAVPSRKAPPLPKRAMELREEAEEVRLEEAKKKEPPRFQAQRPKPRFGGYMEPRETPRDVGLALPAGYRQRSQSPDQKLRPQSELVMGSEAMARGATERHRKVSDWHEVHIGKYQSQTVPRKKGMPRSNTVRGEEDGLRGVGSPSKGRDRRSKNQRVLSSGSNMVKMPRQPRPKRMMVILEYLGKGVTNCVELHKRKLEKMKVQLQEGQAQGRTRQGLHYNLEKQMKSTERHLRKLEFHLAKVEELQEQYEKELKLREGAENILRAFSDANSSKAKVSVNETKQRVKDCTQNMCHLEAELEVNLGVFIMKIEGIAGFARVCRGDVFEISFKYGFQKWKSKCKVEKDLSQTWENAEVMFFPMLADYLQIKVTEIRGIARSNIIIGSLEFDTSDFYQAEPQNLTIDVNEAGTIKLNVVISWSPFQIIEEDLKSLNKNSYGKRERAYTESSVQSLKSQSAAIPTPSKPELSPTPSSLPPSERLDLDDVPMLTLAEALHNVNRLLEILNGQYIELRSLEKQVASLESYLRKKSDIERQESMSSLSIKNALDSFNFLDEVDEGLSDDEEDTTEETNLHNLDDSNTPVPKSKSMDHLQVSAKPDKDGPSISASRPELRLAQRQERPSGKRSSRFLDLSEKRESRMLEVNEQRSSGLLDSPTVDSSFGSLGRSSGVDPGSELLSTGSESIDMVLVQHLMYTEYQLSHLGAFGPLKLKETIALDKLQKQAVIIEQLVMLSSRGDELARADDILPELKLNPALLEFWEQCSEKHSLYVNADLFLLQLDVKFGVKVRTNHPDIADDVFQSLGHRIIERPIDLLDPKAIITLFQYITFFAQEDRKNPERFINDLTNEFELTASLEPGNPDLPKIVKKLPKGVLLPTGNLRALSLLLLEESDTIKNGVRNYLASICNNPKARQKAIHVYSECLEERDLSLRQAGCVALAAMKARESLEQLVYLLRCDMDDVKQTAKEALMTFGEEGRQASQSYVQPYQYTLPQQQQRSDGPLLTTEL